MMSPLKKFSFFWSHKTNIFYVAMGLYSSRFQKTSNVVRISVTHLPVSHVPLFCSYHISKSSVIFY